VSYSALQSASLSQSVPHKQRSEHAKLCLWYEHLWVVQWALQWHRINSTMARGAGGTFELVGSIAMVILIIAMFEWVQQMLPHHRGLGQWDHTLACTCTRSICCSKGTSCRKQFVLSVRCLQNRCHLMSEILVICMPFGEYSDWLNLCAY